MTIKTHSQGFTIVELLIVIVVIAILAALVITAYNGITTQANNSKTAAVVQAYKKALLQYAAEKGSYPVSGASCLGEGYPSNQCFRSNVIVSNNPTFNDRLKPYMGGDLPLPSTKVIDWGGAWTAWGALLFPNSTITLDGQPQHWWLIYMMEGNAKCAVGPIPSITTYPAFSSTPPSSGKTVGLGTAGSECWVPMPDPSKL